MSSPINRERRRIFISDCVSFRVGGFHPRVASRRLKNVEPFLKMVEEGCEENISVNPSWVAHGEVGV